MLRIVPAANIPSAAGFFVYGCRAGMGYLRLSFTVDMSTNPLTMA